MEFTRPWYEDPTADGNTVAVPRVWLTTALSVLIHAALLFMVVKQAKDLLTPGEVEGPVAMSVEIVNPARQRAEAQSPSVPSPPAAAEMRAAPAPRRNAPAPPMTALPREPSPDALRVPIPTITPVPESPIATPKPPPATIDGDLSSYIAARRAERGQSPTTAYASAAEREAARRDRVVAQNLAVVNAPRPLMGDPRNGGGLFEVTLKSYDFAEFKFYGWSREIQRRAPQRFEVRKENNPTIDVAIVRKMIAIIRETQSGDFTWRSPKLGREVTLSARPEDNDALEAFLLKDMFG